jgi:chromosome segregation ATPase
MAISLESVETRESASPNKDEKTQLAQLIFEVETMKDQMSKVAVVLNHLSQASLEQKKQLPMSEPQLSEISQLLQTMKVHVDSFPHALREARRSDKATQKAVETLTARLREIELRMNAASPSNGHSASKG